MEPSAKRANPDIHGKPLSKPSRMGSSRSRRRAATSKGHKEKMPAKKKTTKRRRKTAPLWWKSEASARKRQAQERYNKWLTGPGGNVRGTKESIAQFGRTKYQATEQQLMNREMMGFKGRGDYRTWAKYIPRTIGAVGGAAWSSWTRPGDVAGLIKGAESGWNTGADVSKFIGWGDYGPVTGNQIVGMDSQDAISVNPMNLTGDIYISQTEYLGNVIATGTAGTPSGFEIRQYSLNPGLAVTFPFLSQLANNYVLYEFQGLMFQYKPLAGEDSGSGINLGKVILATNYDPDQPPFTNSFEMQSYDYAQSCKPSCGMVHGVETHPAQCVTDLMYVRSGTSTKARNFTDLGNFFVATEAIPLPAASTSITVGELWVSYRVRLSRANLHGVSYGRDVLSDAFRFTSTAGAALSGLIASPQNRIGCTLSNISATQFNITFPVTVSNTNWLIAIYWENTVAGAQGWGVPGFLRVTPNFSWYCPGDSTNLTAASVNGYVAPPTATASATTVQCAGFQYIQFNRIGDVVTVGVSLAPAVARSKVLVYITEQNRDANLLF